MSSRRGHHEGAIYQMKDGRWVANISIGLDGSGKRLRRVAYARTRAEARLRLRDLQRESEAGVRPAPARLTVGQYLADWLNSRTNLKPSSWCAYEAAIRLRLAPALGEIRLVNLTASDIRRMMADLEEAGVGARTRDYALVTLRVALRQAVKDGMLARNPASLVERPQINDRQIRGLSKDEARALIEAVAADSLGPLYLTLLGTGLRLGEASALTWRDIDLEDGVLTVRQALIRVPRRARRDGEARLRIDRPKTDSSVRAVPLPDFVVLALEEHRRRQKIASIDGLVFTSPSGGPADPKRVHERFQELLAAAGLPAMRVHDVRHAAATAMVASGVPMRVVADILGHADVRMTLKTYSHTLPEMARDAARRMDQYVSKTGT